MNTKTVNDRLQDIARDLDTMGANRLITKEARENFLSAGFLIRELAIAFYDGSEFNIERLMHAVYNVRNNQA